MPKPNPRLQLMTISSLILISLSIYMVLIYAPREIIMGDVQRIFYYHVSSGWIAALAFLVTLITSIIFLATQNKSYDRVAMSSAEIGVIFTTMNIVSGWLVIRLDFLKMPTSREIMPKRKINSSCKPAPALITSRVRVDVS